MLGYTTMNFALRKQISLSIKYISSSRTVKVVPQFFHTFRPQFASEAEFESAKSRLNSLKEDPGNETKLKIYALFKQATAGPCDKPKPGGFDFVGKAKWTAWNGLGSMTKEDARQEYINVVDELAKAEGGSSTATEATETISASDEQAFNTLIYEVVGKAAKITLNRPHAKNAFTREMYHEFSAAMTKAEEDKNVTVAVLTGSGDFYSSGNDLNNFTGIEPDQLKTEAEKGGVMLQKFVQVFIDFPKPLIAAVNGPAVGIACTTLGLLDVVYASDTAYFNTPFPALGQSPEGCSSYIFPKIMGSAKANEILLFGRKITAHEAKERCLVADVFPQSTFQAEVDRRIEQYSHLPPLASVAAKNLIRQSERELLTKLNKMECDLLVKLWQTPECFEAVMNFLSNRK